MFAPHKISLFVFIVMVLWIKNSIAQNAYNHWLNHQKASTHLLAQGNYTRKYTYKSATGRKKDFQLVQQQHYKAGYLKEDIMYIAGQEKLYHIQFQLPAPYTWDNLASKEDFSFAGIELLGLNVVDSTTATYAFTDLGQLKYYVVDNQGSMHAVYTYQDNGLLSRYKDCLAPFNNAYWCAYYVYQYSEKQQLKKILSYNLGQDQLPEQKELFAIDSMVYDKNGFLIERWVLDSLGNATQQCTYQYNKYGRLCYEASTQLLNTPSVKSYKKTFCYYNNKVLKKQVETYYNGQQLQVRQERLYNRSGNLYQQNTYKTSAKPITRYKVWYK